MNYMQEMPRFFRAYLSRYTTVEPPPGAMSSMLSMDGTSLMSIPDACGVFFESPTHVSSVSVPLGARVDHKGA
jgi:hypothetical protein